MKTMKPVLVAILVLLSTSLLADGDNQKNKYRSNDKSKNAHYSYGKVIDAWPVYRQKRVSRPIRECWDEEVEYSSHPHSSNSAGGMAVGGLLGGVIGSQIGKGQGKKLATAAGIIIGAQVGHEAVSGTNGPSHRRYTEYEEHCEIRQQVSYEEVVDGYHVRYEYRGERFEAQMPYHPGKKIKLRVSVEPVF